MKAVEQGQSVAIKIIEEPVQNGIAKDVGNDGNKHDGDPASKREIVDEIKLPEVTVVS